MHFKRQALEHQVQKLTLDIIALASSIVFFKTCFSFSFGATKKKRQEVRQTSNTQLL
jgi:hypothetical protein